MAAEPSNNSQPDTAAQSPRIMGVLRAARGSAVAGDHPLRDVGLRVLAGSTTQQHFNTIRPGLFPIACWRAEDLNFEFGSSFPIPELAQSMVAFREIFDAHCETDPETDSNPSSNPEPDSSPDPDSGPAASPDPATEGQSRSANSSERACVTLPVGGHPPVALFGHADPVGDDAFNKALSGQRARAIHALLTRDVDAWKDLYNDNRWGDSSSQRILETLGFPCGRIDGTIDQRTKDQIKSFQGDNGLSQSGNFDTNTRTKMYAMYMDVLCTDATGVPFKLTKEHFLGAGKDSGFKADYQGCGEFNPVMVLSKDEQSHFDKAENRGERNNENAINRRVVALLFRPHSKIDVASWPCPRASEGTSGCAKRFWSDHSKRRSNTDTRREFSKSQGTFACRFYDRMSVGSPCERGLEAYTAVLSVRLVSECEVNVWSDREITIRGHGLNIATQTDDKGCYFRAPVPSGDYILRVGDATCTLPALPFGSEPHILHIPYQLLPDTWGDGFFRTPTEMPEANP